MSAPHPPVAGRILVVDDQESNRTLLKDMLEDDGYQVQVAVDGPEALRLVAADPPDIVLLDVSMPVMDGLEVCRRLKGEPASAAIPILLVTALAHREHRLAGIAAGANDYLTKPIDRAELVLRVRNAFKLRQLHMEIEARYDRLKALESMRDGLVHMLVHDLRTPLLGIHLYLELLRDDATSKAGTNEIAELVAEAEAVTARMTEMVNDVLDASRLEEGAMRLDRNSVDLVTLSSEAVKTVTARGRGGRVETVAPKSLKVVCDASVIRRVMVNFLSNAVDFSPKDRAVRVRLSLDDGGACVEVVDEGPGIPPEYHEKIFEKFGQVEAVRHHVHHSTGLGLTFCRLAIEAHGGHIGVRSAAGSGSTFWFSLPKDVKRG